MSKTDQFWQYAREAILSVSYAEGDEEEQGLLDLARTWTQAALQERSPPVETARLRPVQLEKGANAQTSGTRFESRRTACFEWYLRLQSQLRFSWPFPEFCKQPPSRHFRRVAMPLPVTSLRCNGIGIGVGIGVGITTTGVTGEAGS